MPERAASVPYNPVPTEQNTGNFGGGFNVKATPEDFGSQVGEAVTKVGDTGIDLVQKRQGMINDTAMVKADSDFATKVGEIKGKYTSLTGMAAYNSFPQYQNDIKQAFQDSRAGLPLLAQHGFDMLATRSMANHIADGSSYASSQLKEANRDSYSSLANTQLQSLLDPDVASNPDRAQYHIDSVKYAVGAQVDENHPGLKTDPKTGSVSFDESTPSGQQGKAQLQQNLDSYLTQAYKNKYDTLSNMNVMDAYDKYQQERGEMPRAAQVALDSSFAPKIFDAHVQNGANTALAQASQDHANLLYNPQSDNQLLSVRNNNPGNLRDPSTGQFRVFNTQEEGATAMQSDLTAKISGNSPAMEKNFGKGYSPTLSNVITTYAPTSENNTSAYINTVSKETGFAPDHVLTSTDIPKLQAAMSKVEAGGSSGGTVIASVPKSYGTNPDGSPLSIADYYRTHSQDVLAKGDAYAERIMPGDLAMKRAVRQTLENQMNKIIANESAQKLLDNKNIMRGINGELTQNKPPETEAELRAIPGMGPLLDKVAVNDPKFTEGIPTMISKMSRQNVTTNSSNGYDTILRTLETDKNPNAIRSVDNLDRQLGRSDGTGINMKDYNDAKSAIELDSILKDTISKHMKDITNANGNLDGKGQQRAIQWYNQVMGAYKKNEALGDKKDPDFADKISQPDGPVYTPPIPSRMTQISNWAKEATGLGKIYVTNSDGIKGFIPAGQMDEALKLGYKKVE